MTTARELCPRCGTVLCDTTVGPSVCPRCELAAALGEAADLPFSGRLGNYELESLIAHGGMGAVYRAYHRETGQTVALKTLLAGRLASAEIRERFLREARLAAQLRHPHIVPLLDVGEADGLPYIAMEFVPGKNLADLARDGPLLPTQAARLLAKAAQAVAYAHEQGILHRDLKPANILLDAAGEPRVADFGLARLIEAGATELTATGQVLGSPGYLAPERVPQDSEVGARNGDTAGVASDVYSLGATLYHLLTGRPPFQGATLDAVLMQVVKTEPIAPRKLNPSVPAALETVCLKCLEKDPRRRYPSATELADDLQRFVAGQPVRARLPGPVARSWRWCRRRPMVATLSGTVAVLLLAVATVSVLAALRTQRDALRLREQLAQSLFSQAQAQNASDLAGSRDAALAALRQAARIRPTLELRNAAIAALGEADLRATGSSRMLRGTAAEALRPSGYNLDPEGRWFIFPRQNQLAFERVSDGVTEFSLESPLGPPAQTSTLVFGGRDHVRLLGFTPSNTVAVWDVPARELLWQSPPQPGPTPLAALAANGEQLLFSPDHLLLLHVDLGSATVTRVSLLPGRARGLRSSPDGQLLTAWSSTNFWVASLPELNWQGPVTSPDSIALGEFDPVASKLAFVLGDYTVWVWDVAAARPLARLSGHSDTIMRAAFEGSSRWLLTTSNDGTTRLWDVLAPEHHVISPLSGHKLGWHPSSSRFLLAQYGTNGLTGVEFQRPAACLALVPRFANRHAGLAPPCLNANGRLLAATTEDYINLLDTRTGLSLARLEMPTRAHVVALFEPEDRALLCASMAGLFRWPLRWIGEGLLEAGPRETVDAKFRAEALARDSLGRWLALAENSGNIRLRDPSGAWRKIPQKAGGLRLAFSPDGRWLAGGSFNQDWLRVWDTASGELRGEFKSGMGVTPGFTPQGRLFAATSTDLVFYGLETGAREAALPREHHGSLRGEAVCSGDGQFLAFSRSRTRVDLLHAPTLQLLASFAGLDNNATVLALDQHGTQLVIGKAGQFFERWDLRRLRAELAELKLDWDLPRLPPEDPAASKPLHIQVKQ